MDLIDRQSDTISRQLAIDALTDYWDGIKSRHTTLDGEMAVYADCKGIIKRLPSAEPEIIRCKDCKYAKYAVTGNYAPYCGRLFKLGGKDTFLITKDSYCSWAERRIDESD